MNVKSFRSDDLKQEVTSSPRLAFLAFDYIGNQKRLIFLFKYEIYLVLSPLLGFWVKKVDVFIIPILL